MFKLIMVIIGGILLLFAIMWGLALHNIAFQSVFRPMQENVNRQVFENTKSYNQGMIQELQNMQFEYLRTTDKEGKASMATVILQRAADFPPERLPSDLRSFIENIKRERGTY
jgi:hypothetical protein